MTIADKEKKDTAKKLPTSEYQYAEKENVYFEKVVNNDISLLDSDNDINISEESVSILTEELITESYQLDLHHEDETCNSFITVHNSPVSVRMLDDDLYLSNSDYSVKDKDYQPDSNTEVDTDTDSRSENLVSANLLLPALTEGVPSTSLAVHNDLQQSHNNLPIKRKVRNKIRIEQIGKKRVRNESQWKANVRKRHYASGKAYISKSGKTVPFKSMKPACSMFCRMKCSTKISKQNRKEIFDFYWDPEKDYNVKRQFIVSCIQSKPTARQRLRSGDESKLRSNTLVYSFVVNGITTAICKTMFLNTLNISQQVVKTALAKRQEGGIVESDKRGKHELFNKTDPEIIESVISHISSFPKYECHYNRERSKRSYLGPDLNVERMYDLYKTYNTENNVQISKIAKSWLYREIFNTKFNLTFKPPEVDTCDDCDMFSAKLKGMEDGPEKQLLEIEKDLHLIEADNRYKLIAQDMIEAKCQTQSISCRPTKVFTNPFFNKWS